MDPKNILIIDDHQLFADGLALILENCNESYKVTIHNCAQEAIMNYKELASANLVLVDLRMPNFDGFAFLRPMRAQKQSVPIGVISGTENESEIELSLSLGANGFIPKDMASYDMLNAVSKLLDGHRYLPNHWEGKIDWLVGDEKVPNPSVELTPRQLEILQLMSDGLQNKQMASALGISVSSIKGHIELLFKNLKVNNRTACVIKGQKLGLI